MGICHGTHKKSTVRMATIVETTGHPGGLPFLKLKVESYEKSATKEDTLKEEYDPTSQTSVGRQSSGKDVWPSISSSRRWSLSTTDVLYAINLSQWHMFGTSDLRAFPYIMLKNATRGFHEENLIGEGEYGSVYKGWIKETTGPGPITARPVAIKMMNELSDAYLRHKDWMDELSYLGHLEHTNIVKLVGYCIDRRSHLLVYEHVPNGNLDYHLSSRGVNDLPLPWAIRLKVALGIATGLAYLHNQHPQVIFKECKAANVLLDFDYNAKLSDYGMARDRRIRDNHSAYTAPEDPSIAQFATTSDVYAFGIILLEILSGRRALDSSRPGKEHVLVTWATSYLSGDTDYRKLAIMDKRLKGLYPKRLACEAAKLAFSCLQAAESRPNMNFVVLKLKELSKMQEPERIHSHLLSINVSDLSNQYVETTSSSCNHCPNSSAEEETDITSSAASSYAISNSAMEMLKRKEK